ncbi:MAG: hypothetical protein SVV03_00135 [Candidatus Nanohaloarchaea archaeon]|nr:hypothetical protein [Candidatus Nanohaloarchaea archaeon]
MGMFDRIFADKEWRDDLDNEVVRKLDKLLKRIEPFKEAYEGSKYKAIAQLWVALAEVYIQVDKMNRRLFHIERLLSDEETQREMEDLDLAEDLKEY